MRPRDPRTEPPLKTAVLPFISVIVPYLNQSDQLRACLRSLEMQDYPGDRFEVIVVDNGSRDATMEIARAAGARVLRCEARGVARARQMGLEAVQTDWVASTDADSLPAPHWLEVLNEAAPGHTALYGPMRFPGVPRHWALASGASYKIGRAHV